jgi:hypothetical protein
MSVRDGRSRILVSAEARRPSRTLWRDPERSSCGKPSPDAHWPQRRSRRIGSAPRCLPGESPAQGAAGAPIAWPERTSSGVAEALKSA